MSIKNYLYFLILFSGDNTHSVKIANLTTDELSVKLTSIEKADKGSIVSIGPQSYVVTELEPTKIDVNSNDEIVHLDMPELTSDAIIEISKSPDGLEIRLQPEEGYLKAFISLVHGFDIDGDIEISPIGEDAQIRLAQSAKEELEKIVQNLNIHLARSSTSLDELKAKLAEGYSNNFRSLSQNTDVKIEPDQIYQFLKLDLQGALLMSADDIKKIIFERSKNLPEEQRNLFIRWMVWPVADDYSKKLYDAYFFKPEELENFVITPEEQKALIVDFTRYNIQKAELEEFLTSKSKTILDKCLIQVLENNPWSSKWLKSVVDLYQTYGLPFSDEFLKKTTIGSLMYFLVTKMKSWEGSFNIFENDDVSVYNFICKLKGKDYKFWVPDLIAFYFALAVAKGQEFKEGSFLIISKNTEHIENLYNFLRYRTGAYKLSTSHLTHLKNSAFAIDVNFSLFGEPKEQIIFKLVNRNTLFIKPRSHESSTVYGAFAQAAGGAFSAARRIVGHDIQSLERKERIPARVLEKFYALIQKADNYSDLEKHINSYATSISSLLEALKFLSSNAARKASSYPALSADSIKKNLRLFQEFYNLLEDLRLDYLEYRIGNEVILSETKELDISLEWVKKIMDCGGESLKTESHHQEVPKRLLSATGVVAGVAAQKTKESAVQVAAQATESAAKAVSWVKSWWK